MALKRDLEILRKHEKFSNLSLDDTVLSGLFDGKLDFVMDCTQYPESIALLSGSTKTFHGTFDQCLSKICEGAVSTS